MSGSVFKTMVSTIQCEDGTIKCDVLVTWYSKLSISGYRTPKKRCTVELPPIITYYINSL